MLKKGGGFSFAFSVPPSSNACQYGLGCRKKKFSSSPFFRIPSLRHFKEAEATAVSPPLDPPPPRKSQEVEEGGGIGSGET